MTGLSILTLLSTLACDAQRGRDTATDTGFNCIYDCDPDPETDPVDDDGDGYTMLEGDCDDSDPDIHPDQAELPGNDVDEDCDGSLSPDTWRLTSGYAAWHGESSGYTGGWDVANVGNVTGTGLPAFAVGAPYDEHAQTGETDYRAAGVTVVECAELYCEAAAWFKASDDAGPSLRFGSFVGGGQDVDGDGFDELLVGDPYYYTHVDEEPAITSGAIWMLYGPVSGTQSLNDADVRVMGDDNWDFIGGSAALLPDLVEPGQIALAVSGQHYNKSTTQQHEVGQVGIWPAPPSGLVLIDDAPVLLRGTELEGHMGYALTTAGDIDGDGVADLAVSEHYTGSTGELYGRAYIVHGPIEPGTHDMADATTLWGAQAGDGTGVAIEALGDANDDGVDDLAISATVTQVDGRVSGTVYVVDGPFLDDVDLAATATATLRGELDGDWFGLDITAPGDWDGDGRLDIAVGAPTTTANGPYPGCVYLFGGDVEGSIDAADAAAIIVGVTPGDMTGLSLDGGVDYTGDGIGELLIGAPYNDDGVDGGGAAYIVASTQVLSR